ncbi:MAG: ligase [Bacteroidetes bacterium]|nr:ligase [Bacteroidota bacterium]
MVYGADRHNKTSMKQSEAKIRIDKLRQEIEEHNHNYYVLNNPVISDFEYDLLLNELETLEKKFPELVTDDSPTRRPGSDITNEFRQYEHQYPMLSLGNTYNEDELREFNTRVEKANRAAAEYVCELKFDGASISITYRNGLLYRALTRGDGTKGDDVTLNIKTIKSIPHKITVEGIPEEFVMRGEILMPIEVFERLNEERNKDGLTPFANPRNAASGTLKLLDPRIVASRHLDCQFYFLLSENNLEPVLLAGSTVKRATLHNADQINMLDLHLDDMVFVEKGGEIIPKIVGVDHSSRAKSSKPVVFINECPECGTPLVRNEGEANHFCPNYLHCPPQLKGRIEHVGETVAKTIASRFPSIDDLMKADNEQLKGIREIGPKIASSIVAFFSDPDNIVIISRLRFFGINFSGDKKIDITGDKLKGKSILISGVFAKHSREEYKYLIEKNGGRNVSALSGNTSFILAGENMGPSKRSKAEEAGVPLMNESEFLKLIGEE